MRQLWYILDIISSLHIKLGSIILDYRILNLGLMEFVLIIKFLGLVDCACILVINLKIFC